MNEPPIHTYNRRWYDGISNMTLALLVSQKLPEEIQSLIAKNLNQVIDECRKSQKRNDKHAVSVGQHRVLGLHKAGRRMRWYDPDPGMHRAFNFMITVPEHFLAEFAGRIIKVGHYVEQQKELYLQHNERVWLEDTVESILQKNVVSFAESDKGFRLVNENKPNTPAHPRHILPARPRKPKG